MKFMKKLGCGTVGLLLALSVVSNGMTCFSNNSETNENVVFADIAGFPGAEAGGYALPANVKAKNKCNTYDGNGNVESNRWIDAGDACVIDKVYTNGFVHVEYPSGSTRRWAYAKAENFDIPVRNFPGPEASGYTLPMNRNAKNKCNTYDENGNVESNRWIDAGDACVIDKVYTNGFVHVEYPSGSTRRWAYAKAENFDLNPNQGFPGPEASGYALPANVTAKNRCNTYDASGNVESNRYVDAGDACVIDKVYTNGFVHVQYPTSSGPRWAYAKIENFNFSAPPTAKPTVTPTAKPTATPTAKPTATPTVKPTADTNAFTYKRDNWAFDNSSSYFKHSDYYMNSSDYSALLKGLSKKEQNRISNDKKEKWGGSCFGMSAIAVLVKSKEFSSSKLPGSPSSLYSATFNNNLESAINYYQLLQDTESFRQLRAACAKNENQQTLINVLIGIGVAGDYNSSPALLGYSGVFKGTKAGGHAVMVYGRENGSYSLKGNTYDIKFKIYDPNSVIHDDQKCLYVNSKSYSWCIPSYSLGTNWNDGNLMFVIPGSGGSVLNQHGLFGNNTKTNTAETGEYYSILSANQMRSRVSIGKIVESSSSHDTTITSEDEIEIFYDSFSDEIAEASMNAILPDKNGKYAFSTDKSDVYNLEMSYEDSIFFVDADNGKRAVFSPDGKCTVFTEGGHVSLNVAFNDNVKTPVPNNNLIIDIEDSTQLDVVKNDDCYILSSPSLKSCEFSSVQDYATLDSLKRKLSTNGNKTMIYSAGNELAVRVFGDLNNDDYITASDMVIMQMKFFGAFDSLETIESEITEKISDMNGDGKVNIADLCMMKNIIVNK